MGYAGVDGGADGGLGRCGCDTGAGHAGQRPTAEPEGANGHR